MFAAAAGLMMSGIFSCHTCSCPMSFWPCLDEARFQCDMIVCLSILLRSSPVSVSALTAPLQTWRKQFQWFERSSEEGHFKEIFMYKWLSSQSTSALLPTTSIPLMAMLIHQLLATSTWLTPPCHRAWSIRVTWWYSNWLNPTETFGCTGTQNLGGMFPEPSVSILWEIMAVLKAKKMLHNGDSECKCAYKL